MGETRRRFDPEFRASAVHIVRERGQSAQAARDLGINAGTPANWVQMDRQAREQEAGSVGNRPSPSVRNWLGSGLGGPGHHQPSV
ncbi:transposase [Nonomuraea muscovyensis]|uniref:transposase n=1 Tax=Nonomuraea muscovyensis TaxID=1124761 RepID=UPI001C87CE93|nr:transposase [Nonomuraea muscovyensis]